MFKAKASVCTVWNAYGKYIFISLLKDEKPALKSHSLQFEFQFLHFLVVKQGQLLDLWMPVITVRWAVWEGRGCQRPHCLCMAAPVLAEEKAVFPVCWLCVPRASWGRRRVSSWRWRGGAGGAAGDWGLPEGGRARSWDECCRSSLSHSACSRAVTSRIIKRD